MTKVKFLIEKPEGDLPCNVFAFFPEMKHNDFETNLFTCYAHLGQHSACHLDYANECKEANYNEYSDLLKELIGQGYTTLNVINTQTIECYREPTESEVKFGHGAIHWKTFKLANLLNKKGKIKTIFTCKSDNLKYRTQ